MADWLTRLEHQHGGIEDSGARGLDRALGTLLDGVALRGVLRTCPEAVRLEDVLDTRGLVLFSLDTAEYPHATRKVASWILLGMGRLARHLHAPPALHRAGGARTIRQLTCFGPRRCSRSAAGSQSPAHYHLDSGRVDTQIRG